MSKEKVDILEKSEFPEKLKIIDNSPEKIYLKGNKSLLYENSFAVIGTRKITKYGVKCTEKIVTELALRNITITSGMALGTDTLAHKIALENNCKTIAVLGGGFNYIYPKENKELFEEILENNGLIISEYPPEEKYKSEYFPKRNRIVSAISEGVLVIEATYRSGTSITVDYARKQGKKIFAIPGNIDSKYSHGVHKAIKEGAILTTNIEDILMCYPQFINKKRKTKEKNQSNNRVENLKYKKYIELIKKGNKTFDEILLNTLTERNELKNILFEMEIEGIIEEKIGEGFVLKETKN